MIPEPIAEFRADRRTATAEAPGEELRPAHGRLPASGELPRWDVLRALRAAAALAGLAVIGAYLAIALDRLGYPFTLEILESNSLVEVHRLVAGQPLYAAPAVSYVPDGYPPLYFAVSAALAGVLGPGYLPLRLVSLVSSLACFAIVTRLVQRETESAAAGMAAAGVLAATYFAASEWFDVARVDSLFLALSAAALYAARWMHRTRGAIAAGLLLGAAFLTKQTALAEGVAVLAAAAAGPRRRLAVPAALTYAAVLGGSTLVLGLVSHGWYVYYVFVQMSEHKFIAASAVLFWTRYLLPTLGIAMCAVMLGARRMPVMLLAGCSALVVEGYAALVHAGGNVNDALPAYLVVALLAGLAMGERNAGRHSVRARQWLGAVVAGLVVAQVTVLATGFRPSRAIPSNADRAAGLRLMAGVRALGGTVLIPADPGLALMAGLPPGEDQVATADVLHASDQAAQAAFTGSVARAVAQQQFTAIMTRLPTDLRGFPADLTRYYFRCPQMPLIGLPAAPFQAGTGAAGQQVSLWLPVGRGSCVASLRALKAQD